ncbi:MAG: FHA domain-containing protein, partial [Gemmataceae bacterium]
AAPAAPALPAAVATVPPLVKDDALPFKPTQRPPIALLCILDDGSEDDGEWLRLRADQFVIGRTEGEIIIPHDGRISKRHASLTRQKAEEKYRWYLTDLQSSNGTYVQVADAPLKSGREFLVGGTRLRFDAPKVDLEGSTLNAPSGGATQGWQGPSLLAVLPSIVFLNADNTDGRAVPITGVEAWVGRDRGCTIAVPDDPFLSAKHCRVFKDAGGQWHLKNNDSANGVWLRIDQPLPIKKGSCHFLLGEQRFLLRVLS